MVGKPAPQEPSAPSMIPPAKPPANPPAAPGPTSNLPTGPAPIGRNSPSAAAVNSMADVSSGGHDQRRRRRASSTDKPARLVSLDAFRGFIMMMLAASGFGLLAFSRIDETSPVWTLHDRALWQRIGFHFDHPAWVSSFDTFKVSFWDLIQPAFMFMVGAAMPFSNARRESQGHGTISRTLHALVRSVALVLLGVFLYSMGHERTNWIFPNVLCQIGLGYFFAWLLMHLRTAFQLVALVLILVGYWGWFMMNPPPADYDYSAVNATKEKGEVFEGKFAPWSKNANAAFFFDGWLLPQLRSLPETNDEPQASVSKHSAWQFVSLVNQEAEKSAPEETPAAAETPAADSTPASADTGAADTPTTTPAAETPTSEPITSEDLPAENTVVIPATPDVTEPSAPVKPYWFSEWFLSNTEPYTFNGGGYTTLNFIPSIGTMLLGILCGNLLMNSESSRWKKLAMLLIAAVVCMGLGILAGETVCPVVKRIWTPGWVLFSGGYVIGMLALFYLLFDILPFRILAFPLVVVGMNSILIYLLGQTISGWMRESIVKVHLSGMIENVFGPKALDPLWYGPITLPTTVFALYWLFLLWLYRQRIFLKL